MCCHFSTPRQARRTSWPPRNSLLGSVNLVDVTAVLPATEMKVFPLLEKQRDRATTFSYISVSGLSTWADEKRRGERCDGCQALRIQFLLCPKALSFPQNYSIVYKEVPFAFLSTIPELTTTGSIPCAPDNFIRSVVFAMAFTDFPLYSRLCVPLFKRRDKRGDRIAAEMQAADVTRDSRNLVPNGAKEKDSKLESFVRVGAGELLGDQEDVYIPAEGRSRTIYEKLRFCEILCSRDDGVIIRNTIFILITR